MSDFSDDDEGDYSTLVQRYRKKQQSTSSSSNRHALIEKKMNNNAGVKNGKPKVEKQKEDVASVSDSDDDDDDDLSLSEAPRKKPKPSLVVSHGDSDDELDCILNARLIEPSHPNHHKDTAAFDALAKITKELNAAEQAASLEKLPSFTPPRTPPE
uniref:Uncharacterized protein n=1 Tax=Plectus sambesii TaxID=2011161 RepID=A0A914URU4_9BILA